VAHYLDTSALVKLVVAESESDALRAWLATSGTEAVSSDLARTELMRAVRRALPDRAPDARALLDSLFLLTLGAEIFESAGRLDPATLRTLDAVHVAASLELGDELDGLVTYDDRLASAARSNGIVVVTPV
jgi:predicted nucleic acid-binding protein